MDKSALRNQQYRPISMGETIAGAAMSVRQARDFALGVNNAHARACAPTLTMAWPSGLLIGGLSHTTTGTEHHVLLRLPPMWVGPVGHYNLATWTVCASIDGSGVECLLRMFSSTNRYTGPDTITSPWFKTLGDYSYDPMSASTAWPSSGVVTNHETLQVRPNANGQTYFMLTDQFVSADPQNTVRIMSLTLTLTQVEQDI